MHTRALVLCMALATPARAIGTNYTDPRIELRFDDPSSGAATDSSANSNNGTLAGDAALATSSKPALPGNVGVLVTSGSGYASVPSSGSLQMAGDFSVSTWVRLDSELAGENNLVSKDNPSSGLTNFNVHIYQHHPMLAVTFTAAVSPGAVSNGSSFCDAGGCAAVMNDNFIDNTHPLGTWRLVTATYTDSQKTMRVYLDCGAPVVAAFTTAGGPFNDASTLQVGERKANSSSHTRGAFDEVRVWGAVLSDDDVKALAVAGGLCAPPPDMTPPPDLATPDLAPLRDLAPPLDATIVNDLAMPDLGVPDLAMSDLAAPDLAPLVDQSIPQPHFDFPCCFDDPLFDPTDWRVVQDLTVARLDDIVRYPQDALAAAPDLAAGSGASPAGCSCAIGARVPARPIVEISMIVFSLIALARLRRSRRPAA